MKTVAFHTLGCKVNTYESNAMLKILMKQDIKKLTLNKLLMFMLSILVQLQIRVIVNHVK